MTKINGEVYLIMLRNIIYTLLVLHVDCYELITYLRCMLCVVLFTKLLGCDGDLQFWLVFQFDSFTLNLLTPTIFVETLPEEDHVE